MKDANLVYISENEVVTKTEFAFYMKNVRISLGLSQEEMAQIIGMSVDTVKKYETGKRIPKDPYKVVTAIREYIKTKRK